MHSTTRTTLLAAVVSAAFGMGTAVAQDDYQGDRQAQTRYERDYERMTQDQRQERQHERKARKGTQVAAKGEQQWLDRIDRQIAQKAMNVNAGSIQLSQLAEDRVQDERLQRFAQNVIEENRQAMRQLAAMSKNLRTGRAEPTPLDKWAIERLRQIRDPQEFQQAYTDLMAARAQMKLDGLQMLARSERSDPQLRRFAQRQLQDVRGQLHVTHRLQEQQGGAFAAAGED